MQRRPERRFVRQPHEQGTHDAERHLEAPGAFSGPEAVDDNPYGGAREDEPGPGKEVKLVRPGVGRKYHSIGSGSQASCGIARTIGVSNDMRQARHRKQHSARHVLRAPFVR